MELCVVSKSIVANRITRGNISSSGVMCRTNRIGTGTDPWGTPYSANDDADLKT